MKTSQYVGVSRNRSNKGTPSQIRYMELKPWKMKVYFNGRSVTKNYGTEREAAIAYDKYVLEHGLDRPLNILKRKEAA